MKKKNRKLTYLWDLETGVVKGTGQVARVMFQVLICTDVTPCHIVFKYFREVR